jgi:L-ascorbate metabolism protein UlaG (beta-lactamase superfamily)
MQIQRLNMDNSWHIRIGGMSLLVDPWLEGVEIDYFSWFNTQWHRTAPIPYEELPEYDWVLITQKYPDHYHKKTLLRLQPKKILVPASIEKSVRKLLPDAEVVSLGSQNAVFEKNGVSITWHATNRKIDPIYDAYLIQDHTASVFLATHGYDFEKTNMHIDQPVTLLISPFNEFKLPFFLGGMVSPGLKGLTQLTKHLQPKHILATHDEDKHAKGLVIRMAKIKRFLSSDLSKIELFKDRILNLPDYKQITL